MIKSHVAQQDFRWQPAIRARVVNELTVAVIGVGRIGSRVAAIFKGFGARVVAYDIEPRDEFKSLVEYQTSLLDAVKVADIVTIHMPATTLNYHQFNLDLFKQFKPGSVLVNTARGQIVDTVALLDALDTELLEAAAIDVYEHEDAVVPLDKRNTHIEDDIFRQLLAHPKIIYTPHIAYYTDTAVKQLIFIPLDATLEIIQSGTTDTRLN